MRFGVVSLFPEMFNAICDYGVVGRAVQRGQVSIQCWDPRSYTEDRHQTVDDRPYGGGPGMLMKVEPLRQAIRSARAGIGGDAKVAYLSPQGRSLDHAGVMELASRESLILVAGRYEGIDERLIEADIDEEWSIGDYVLSGGELGAMVIIDAVSRLLPDVLGHDDSASQDSFVSGLLDCPHYTRPEILDGQRVPDVLLSGHHGEIERWRLKQSLGRTWLRRPDLLKKIELDAQQQLLLCEFKAEYEAQQAAE